MKPLEPRLQPVVSDDLPREPRLAELSSDPTQEPIPPGWEERLWERMSAAWEEGDEDLERLPLLASLEPDIHDETIPTKWEVALEKKLGGPPLTLEEVQSPKWPAEVHQLGAEDPFEPFSVKFDRGLRTRLGFNEDKADGSIFWVLVGSIAGAAVGAVATIQLLGL